VADLLAAARSVAPIVEAHAEASEAAGKLADAVWAALVDAGLPWILVPRVVGGAEADLRTTLEVFEELARQDGSVGWTLMASATSTAFGGAYTSDAAAAAIFARPGATLAGQFSPRGQAVVEDGGHRVSGRYAFGSGALHASYVAGGTIELRDGQMVTRAGGTPDIRAVVLPADEVALLGGWDVVGLRATGSVDYAIDDRHVPDGWSFSIFTTDPQRGGHLYRLGVMTLTAVGHAGFALGVARRALDEIAALAHTRQRLGQSVLADSDVFVLGYARAEAGLRAARAFVFDAFQRAEDVVAAGGAADPGLAALARLATTHVTDAAVAATTFAFRASGSVGLRTPSTLQRCFRDVQAGAQHLFVDDRTWLDGGRTLLASAAPPA
jgi:indole-3-acetate monooxygenase